MRLCIRRMKLNLCILRRIVDIFSLDVAYIVILISIVWAVKSPLVLIVSGGGGGGGGGWG